MRPGYLYCMRMLQKTNRYTKYSHRKPSDTSYTMSQVRSRRAVLVPPNSICTSSQRRVGTLQCDSLPQCRDGIGDQDGRTRLGWEYGRNKKNKTRKRGNPVSTLLRSYLRGPCLSIRLGGEVDRLQNAKCKPPLGPQRHLPNSNSFRGP